MNNFTQFLLEVDWMGGLFLVLMVTFLMWLRRLDRKGQIVMAEFLKDANGHADKYALAYVFSMLISTFGFWYLLVHRLLTEWYFTAYIGAFVLGAAAKSFSIRQTTSGDVVTKVQTQDATTKDN